MLHNKADACLPDSLPSQVVVFDWTPNATPEVTYVSSNAVGLLGIEIASRALSLPGLIALQDRERFLGELGAIGKTDDAIEHDAFQLILPNGESRWVHGQSCRGPDGAGLRTHVFAHDAIHRSEMARLESEARNQQIFDTNLAVKLLIDPADGRIVEANRAAARFYGYARDQLEQMNISEINTLSESELSQEMNLARSEERLFFNFRHRLASGEVRDVEVYSGPMAWQQSRLLYSIVFDVTDRNRATEALKEKKNDLVRTLIELKSTQKELVQRERLAAAGQFTVGIAHDFNNLLTGILATGELLQLSPNLTDTQRRDVDVIVSSGERASNMIRQLLDFCSQSSSECHAVDLQSLLQEAAILLRSAIPKAIALQIQSEENLSVYANSTQLQQLLLNLAFNARDSMPGGGELRISVRESTVGEEEWCALCQEGFSGAWALLEVIDTGHGIGSEDLPKIFEPFFTLKGSGRGSGLGLAQVAGIVNQHGGHITVDSDNKGTAFRVYFRRIESPAKPSDGEKNGQSPSPGSRQKILLVEDAPLVRHAVSKMLGHLKYEVIQANNGFDAFEIFQQDNSIDLVLSDIVMPKMDGLTLLTRMKELRPHTPVILMSGYPTDEAARVDSKTRCLTKPMKLRELSEAIEAALSHV